VALVALEEELHRELLESVQEVLSVLNEEIGKTSLITRTKQHLYRQVVALRIAQQDHLETEEALVLPMVRKLMDEGQQLEAVRRLLIDEEAEDPRWVIDWVARALDREERQSLADLEARFQELPSSAR
jgi:hemerythrin superfamily protein